MDATGREQSHNVDRFPCCDCRINCLHVSRIACKLAIGNGLIDASDGLVHNAPRPETHVPHLRVSHLPLGQADIGPGTRHQRMRGVAPQAIKVGGLRGKNGVVFGGRAVTETIQNDE